MRRYLLNKKIFEQKLFHGQYHFLLHYLNRFLNIRFILSLAFLLSLVFIFQCWSNRINFGSYSYVFTIEKVLEKRSSRFANITVAQSGSLRMLRFDPLSLEGVMHTDNPYLILFDYMKLQLLALLWNSDPERILIIGLGAGILPKLFHYLCPNTLIDIVEIDSDVVDLARKYFNFNDNKLIRVHVEDGRHFIERHPSNRYDFIIIDAFTANRHVPHSLRTTECLGEYIRILKSTGLVIANFLAEQESRYRQTFAQALFQAIYRGRIKGNLILIGLNKQAKVYKQDTLQLRAAALQQSKLLPDMDWVEQVKHIYYGNDDQWNKSAKIFTDEIYEDFIGLSEQNHT